MNETKELAKVWTATLGAISLKFTSLTEVVQFAAASAAFVYSVCKIIQLLRGKDK